MKRTDRSIPSLTGRGRRVSITDVARLSGVSKTAVSAVLNGRTGTVRVSDDKRAAIMLAAEQLKYVPDAASRAMARDRYQVIDLFCSMGEVGGGRLIHAIHAQADKLSQRVGLHNLQLTAKVDNQWPVPAVLKERGMDGIIVACDVGTDIEEQIAYLAVPTIWANTNHRDTDNCISFDEEPVAEAMGMRIGELGHQRIAYLVPNPLGGHFSETLRPAALKRGISRIRTDFEIVTFNDLHQKQLADVVDRILDQYSDITCLVCYSGSLVMPVMRRLYQRGIHIPNDMSVVSFDVSPEYKWMPVAITGTELPHGELGTIAVQMLHDRIEGQGKTVPSQSLDCQFVERESLGSKRQ